MALDFWREPERIELLSIWSPVLRVEVNGFGVHGNCHILRYEHSINGASVGASASDSTLKEFRVMISVNRLADKSGRELKVILVAQRHGTQDSLFTSEKVCLEIFETFGRTPMDQAALNNRANQLNPNNRRYQGPVRFQKDETSGFNWTHFLLILVVCLIIYFVRFY